jgi:hypothetical protein
LLEGHLLEKSKFCPDCISKHLLTLEGFAQEGQDLDASRGLCQTFEALEDYVHRWETMYSKRIPVAVIGQEVRKVRKQLAQHVVDPECSKLDVGQPQLPAQVSNYSGAEGGSFTSMSGLVLVAAIAGMLWAFRDIEQYDSSTRNT